ncbi:heparan-alpha-glucosaminide N-acetyltransferase [Desulfitobacterium sp.]|uniref:heparan-alpha-glucosaminide N-acetyltransferase n=1 Tax=Desulfitobacterium sp. TaxID=49981 RepID=UPI002B1EC12C|nr:heparan-alpha-glucosaminide N-acetyltransferase [Desulfitobacterium sp.]MEA4900214.1 heparan-alpha-glucosaminide N-acetyltransferase [Desulfitobacterium sp.]
MKGTSSRIPGIDIARTFALILMILYHFIYDLDAYTPAPIRVDSRNWYIMGKLSAFLFIFLAGISSGFSHHPFRKAFRILFWALIITLATYIVMPGSYVRFGILHFLGVMALLYPFLHKQSTLFLILYSILALVLGFIFSRILISGPWLLPLGIYYPGITTIDIYPLFPYSAVSALGILYYRFKFASSDLPVSYPLPSIIEKMSKNSLLIYLVHQPILLTIIFIAENFSF